MAYKNELFVKTKDGIAAPKGFHYMPNGKLMSDADHIAMYGYIKKTITGLNIDTTDINHQGETKNISLNAQEDAYFSVEVFDDSAATNYYNFDTGLFSTTRPNLKIIKFSSQSYNLKINFAAHTGSLKKYTINIIARTVGNVKTVHAPLQQARFIDNTIDLNNSTGSDSEILTKILYQDAAKSLYLSCIAPSRYTAGSNAVAATTSSSNTITIDNGDGSTDVATNPNNVGLGDKVIVPAGSEIVSSVHALVTAIDPGGDDTNSFQISVADSVTNNASIVFTPPFNGMTPHYTESTTGRNTTTISSGGSLKTSFTVTCTAKSDRVFRLLRTPNVNDLCAVTEVTFGAAAVPIDGENTSSSTLFYRWPLTNIAGLSTGMSLDPQRRAGGENTITPASISRYITTTTNTTIDDTGYGVNIVENTVDDVVVEGVDAGVNDITTIDRNGRVTAQAGNVVFDVQQHDGLKSDTNVRIIARGPSKIKTMTGIDVSLSDVTVTFNQVSTTTTSAVSNSTTIPVADVGSISGMPNTTTIRGVNINPSVANPTVVSKSTNDGAGNITASAAQTLEDGQTLFFDNTSNILTITGSIQISNMAIADTTLYFDVERFLDCS